MNIREFKEAKEGGVLFLTLFLGIRRLFIRKKYGREEASNQKSADLQSIERVIIRKLKKKYRKKAIEIKQEIDDNYNLVEHHRGRTIWILWLQGFDNAPEIVKICCHSVIKNKPKHMDVVLLDRHNINYYIKLPQHIDFLYERGNITFQTYSDLIRLELLTRYGGTWIDATVLISSMDYPAFIFDSKLFLYQNLFPTTWGMASVMNSWFISSESGNKILDLTKRLMFEYYKNSKYTCDYWLIYDFFEVAIEQYKDEFLDIVPMAVEDTHILQSKLVDKYNQKIYEQALRVSSIHKLQWRFSQKDLLSGDTTYKHIKSDFGINVD